MSKVTLLSNRGRASSDDREPTSQQVTGVAHVRRIDVGRWKVAASQQHGQLFGIDAIRLRLSPVYGFQVKCVAEQKRQILSRTKIGEPVPVEGGFTADDQVALLKRLQRDQELLGCFGVEVFLCSSLFPPWSTTQTCIELA